MKRVVLAAALLVAVSCKKGEGGDEAKNAVPAVVGARTALATTQSFAETVDAIGTVVVRAGHMAALGAPSPARVARVLVAAGQHVSAGQPLVELEQAPFVAATRSAQAAVAVAEQSHARAERLAQEGIVPRKDVEQAAAELARAQADLANAQRAEQLSVLRAPLAGVVTRMTAALGAAADPSQPLVEVADPSALDILLNVTPAMAARIRPGARVALGAGERASGEPLGEARVADVAGIVDTASRSVAVRVRSAQTRRALRIGETVFGRISVGTRPAAVTVPLEALVPEGEGFKVFVVDSAGIAHARAVTVGGKSDQVAEITEGLKAGERVVTYGAFGVQDSARIVQGRP
jgi:cobalt-zinc-cadmium efflux system membrane fusion protein